MERQLGLGTRAIQPPSYLPLAEQKPIPVTTVQGAHKAFLQVGQDWRSLHAPEVEVLKNVLVLFKTFLGEAL